MRDEIEQIVAEHQFPSDLARMYRDAKDPLTSLLACRLAEVAGELAGADEALEEELDGLNKELTDAHNAEIATYDEKIADLEAQIEELEKGRTPTMANEAEILKTLTTIGDALGRIADTLEKASVAPVAAAPEKPAPKKAEKPKEVDTPPADEPAVETEAPTITADQVQDKMIDLVGLIGRAPAKAILEGFIPEGQKVVLGNVPEDKLPELYDAVEAALVDVNQQEAA